MRKAAILILLLFPQTLRADQVFLKDAGSVAGRIVSETATRIQVDVGGGIVGVPKDRVDRIERGRSALDDYDDRAKALAPKDVEGWRKLGKWASSAGLSAQAREAYQKVLAQAPNDPEANKAFGRVELNGRFVTEEESYRARGFVQYDGQWMTPAEVQAAQAHAASVQARRDAEDRARAAEEQARAAEKRAADAEAEATKARSYSSSPFYWGGGWGYGVSSWPAGTPAPPATFTPKSELRRMPK